MVPDQPCHQRHTRCGLYTTFVDRIIAHPSAAALALFYAFDPILFSPFRDPRLSANPCERLRILTKPVIAPSSPSFSMLTFARASSPRPDVSGPDTRDKTHGDHAMEAYQTRYERRGLH